MQNTYEFSKRLTVKKRYDVIVAGGGVAGEAACLALEEACAVSDVTVKTLQARLEQANVMIHFPDAYLPEDKTVIIDAESKLGEILMHP